MAGHFHIDDNRYTLIFDTLKQKSICAQIRSLSFLTASPKNTSDRCYRFNSRARRPSMRCIDRQRSPYNTSASVQGPTRLGSDSHQVPSASKHPKTYDAGLDGSLPRAHLTGSLPSTKSNLPPRANTSSHSTHARSHSSPLTLKLCT